MRFIKLFKDTFKFGIKLVSAFLGTYAVHKFMPEYADPALMVGILYGSFVTAFFLKNSFVTLIWGVNGKPARAPKIKSTPISVREMETYVAAPKPKRTRSTKTETRVAAPAPKPKKEVDSPMGFFNATIYDRHGRVYANNVRVHAHHRLDAEMRISNDPMWRNVLVGGGAVKITSA